MSDREFDEYIKERDGRKNYRAAFEDYYGKESCEDKKDRISLEMGCSWVRLDDGSSEG